jgi:hypothetical protein
VAFEFTLLETELEELREQVFVLGERDHAVADVAGREHLEVFAEPAGRASVVGDGDDGGEIVDAAGVRREDGLDAAVDLRLGERGAVSEALGDVGGAAGGGGWRDEALESAKERRKAGASADGDDTQGGLGGSGFLGGGHYLPV